MKSIALWTFAALFSVVVIGATAANAICIVGFGDCPPSEADGKQAFVAALVGILEPPYTVEKFQKIDVRQGPGAGLYEMNFVATVRYSGEAFPCIKPYCKVYNPIVDEANKTVAMRDWLVMRKTERGWIVQ
jgi:hypothetical protein